MRRRKILFVFGTRPEAIKLAPLIKVLRREKRFKVGVCVTAQHRQMLDQVLDLFGIVPDFDLKVMCPEQTLFSITAVVLHRLEHVYVKFNPDLVVVQGDTTTAFVGALAAYYKKIQIAHVEAGLRSGDKHSPFPEEINRVLISKIADFHFAPTETAKANLKAEGVTKNVWVVGNTGVDALLFALGKISKVQSDKFAKEFNFINLSRKIVLVTGHRRESFGMPFKNMCQALRRLALNNPMVEFVYPVHLNPNVRKPVYSILKFVPNFHLIEPLDYLKLVWLMQHSCLIMTDSGGIQEEAPTLRKPVLVLRDVTERPEGLTAGVARLLGTTGQRIVEVVQNLISSTESCERMRVRKNPYGDGRASRRIHKILLSGEGFGLKF